MASSFKIPKRKHPADSDSAHVHVQSPLSRLQGPAPQLQGYGATDRVHAGNKTSCQPLFRDVVKTILGLNGGGASPAANRRPPGSESTSASLTNRWRPQRASDRLLKPQVTLESPPQKKKSTVPGSISVESLDSLAELRHDGSLSSSNHSTGRRHQQVSTSPPESPVKQKKSSSSVSGSDPASEDDFLSPSRTRLPAAKARPSSSSVSTSEPRTPRTPRTPEDVRERQRERWREFRERRTRLEVLKKPRKQNQNPTEPIVLSSEDEEDDRDDAAVTPRSCRPSETGLSLPPPSFLQLDFSSLHAGLMDAAADHKMTITDNGITLPLKGEENGEVTVVASQLRGYGVWDGGVAKGGGLLAAWEGPAPSLLFLWVTDAQANVLQRELSAIQTCTASGPPCPFLLVVLREQLQELQSALLASILDMEEYRQGRTSSSCSSSYGGLASPLDWTEGLALLHSCPPPLDQHLLRLLGHSAKSGQKKTSAPQQLPTRLVQYPVSPCKGRITISQEDMSCLEDGNYLNDVIIDFYLKFLLMEGVEDDSVSKRSHVFSSFFFKQLSRRRTAGEDGAPCVQDRYVRHQRVKTWTRSVDIFTKDFLFVPVNQESHWFLVVVCFPGLEDVQFQKFQPREGDRSEREAPPPECSELGCRRTSVLKRPCVLVMDSLKLSQHEDVCRLIREYLQVEWEVRRRTSRVFSTMRSCSCRVPRQDNSSDCGVYLLQYVEAFLQVTPPPSFRTLWCTSTSRCDWTAGSRGNECARNAARYGV
ncbi:sentrin-specific protease 7b isoform X2 [Mugil cephalus]|uniref:sentrin-specific protease 7b isoform X2 n=2 Tax=Mugil cephalus TaxID=48193 RepID=UPI001FB74653|nr:sentrin-specific protease 7b isoform X2 [Mugil cephalus]